MWLCQNMFVITFVMSKCLVPDHPSKHYGTGRYRSSTRVRSTLKSAWILTLVLKSAWIWSEPWKLHKILEKCLNYSIPSLNFFGYQINEISHSVFCIVILYAWMSVTLCFFAEFIFFFFFVQFGKRGHLLIGLRDHCQFATWLHTGFNRFLMPGITTLI